jgi:hypothetical protein
VNLRRCEARSFDKLREGDHEENLWVKISRPGNRGTFEFFGPEEEDPMLAGILQGVWLRQVWYQNRNSHVYFR